MQPLILSTTYSFQKKILSIFANEELWKEVDLKIFGKKLEFPTIYTLQELQDYFSQLEYQKGKLHLIQLIIKKSYHSEELINYFQKKGFSASTIKQLIDKGRQEGWLDDLRWLEAFFNHHQKKLSFQAVCYKLLKRGISQESFRSFQTHDDVQAIHTLIETRYRRRDLSNLKEKNRLFAALLRRGFAPALVKQALDNRSTNTYSELNLK